MLARRWRWHADAIFLQLAHDGRHKLHAIAAGIAADLDAIVKDDECWHCIYLQSCDERRRVCSHVTEQAPPAHSPLRVLGEGNHRGEDVHALGMILRQRYVEDAELLLARNINGHAARPLSWHRAPRQEVIQVRSGGDRLNEFGDVTSSGHRVSEEKR